VIKDVGIKLGNQLRLQGSTVGVNYHFRRYRRSIVDRPPMAITTCEQCGLTLRP
jgi:hypothetical protein